MKIAQISATFPPYMGGTGNVSYNYSLELAKLGHDVTVYTSSPTGNLNYNHSNLIKVKSFKPLFKIGNAPFIPDLLKINDYDIIHLHYPFFFGAEMIYLIHKLKSKKYIITYHNDVIYNGLMGILKIHNKTIMKLIMNNAEKICVTSMDYAQNSELKAIINSRSKDIVEIPNGINIDNFSPNKSSDELKDLYNFQNKNIILFVGSLDKAHHFKGIKYLLMSFKNILDEKGTYDPYLIIIGEGDLKNHYISISRELGINERTIFTGGLSHTELVNFYKMADLLILPSTTMGEAFGIVLIEAMALSKPVIASNLPGVRTVVDDSENGFLVKPKDTAELSSKIKLLLDNKDLRDKMGHNGRIKAEKEYSWSFIVKKLEDVYEDCICNF